MAPAAFVPQVRGTVGWVLRRRTLAWLGLISYGIYLWHGPIVEKIAATHLLTSMHGAARPLVLGVLTAAVTVPCAALSYYGVERPLLRLKERPLRPAARGR